MHIFIIVGFIVLNGVYLLGCSFHFVRNSR